MWPRPPEPRGPPAFRMPCRIAGVGPSPQFGFAGLRGAWLERERAASTGLLFERVRECEIIRGSQRCWMPGEFRIAVDGGIAYNNIAAGFGRPRQGSNP